MVLALVRGNNQAINKKNDLLEESEDQRQAQTRARKERDARFKQLNHNKNKATSIELKFAFCGTLIWGFGDLISCKICTLLNNICIR